MNADVQGLPRSFRRAARPLARFWLRSGHREQLSRALASSIGRLHGIVLDVGGGRPALLDAVWERNARRLRVDVSLDRRPDVNADATSLPFRSASVDGVVMCELLEHVPFPQGVVAEAHRVLRPGGLLLGSVPFIMGLHGDPDDFFRYTESGLRQLLTPFSRVAIRPHGNHIGAAWRLLTLRFPAAVIANPVVRLTSNRADARCPEGYTFGAVK